MKSQHKINWFLLPAFFILISFFEISCNTTNSNKVKFEDGISLQIKELLGDDLLDVLVNELDVPINRGKNPPNIEAVLLSSSSSPAEATVVMRPSILVKTNVPYENVEPGHEFADTYFRFGNQNMKKYTIDFDRTSIGVEPFLGTGSFIIGEGNKFSIFGKQEEIVGLDTVTSVNFLSGTVVDGGVSDAIGGIMVIKDHNVSGYIPKGTGRSFKDENNFLSLDEWPAPAKIQTNDSLKSAFDPFVFE